METILQDLRYASRILWKQPGFALTAILTLAVGIGANTAIYSVVDATLLRTLPFDDPDRLMRVSLTWPERYGRPAVDDGFWSYPKYQTFRQLQQVFEDIALYRERTFNLTGTDEAERLRVEVVSAGYFPILGIRTQTGRLFLTEEDATPDTHAVAILSYGLWQRRFGGDQTVVGRNISLDNRSYTVVGVLPPAFQGLTGGAEIWLPTMTSGAREISMPFWHEYQMIGRLKPEVSEAQAKSAVALLGQRVDETHPDPRKPVGAPPGMGAKARTLNEARIDPAIRKSVLVLFGAVAFVLLIACVNIANLLLARGSARKREIATAWR